MGSACRRTAALGPHERHCCPRCGRAGCQYWRQLAANRTGGVHYATKGRGPYAGNGERRSTVGDGLPRSCATLGLSLSDESALWPTGAAQLRTISVLGSGAFLFGRRSATLRSWQILDYEQPLAEKNDDTVLALDEVFAERPHQKRRSKNR